MVFEGQLNTALLLYRQRGARQEAPQDGPRAGPLQSYDGVLLELLEGHVVSNDIFVQVVQGPLFPLKAQLHEVVVVKGVDL